MVCSCRQHGQEGVSFFFLFLIFFPHGVCAQPSFFTGIGDFFGNEAWLPCSHELPFIKEQKGSSWKMASLCNYRIKKLGFHFCFFIWSASVNIFVHSPNTEEPCTECSVCDSTIILLFNWCLTDRCNTCLFLLFERTCNNCSIWFLEKHLGASELSIPSLFPHCTGSIWWTLGGGTFVSSSLAFHCSCFTSCSLWTMNPLCTNKANRGSIYMQLYSDHS